MALYQTFRIAQCSICSVSNSFVSRHGATAMCLSTKTTPSPKKGSSAKNEELIERAVLLANTINANPKQMQDYLKSNSSIVSMNKHKFVDIANLIKMSNFKVEDVLKYPRLFHLSLINIRRRIAELHNLGLDMQMSIVTLSENRYKRRISSLLTEHELARGYNYHEHLLIHTLHCTAENADLVLREHTWLRNSKISTLIEGIEIIQHYGVSNNAILGRIHAIIISPDELKRQLSTLQDKGIYFKDYPQIYLSLLHPQDSDFQNGIQRLLNDTKILQEGNCKTKEEYILYRLKCTSEDLIVILKRFPILTSIRLPKLKQNLDILLNEYSFTSQDIIDNPRIISYAYSTLRKRCDALDALNIDVTMKLLMMTHVKFHEYIEEMCPTD